MVAFTFADACGWDCLEKPDDLLVGGIGLPIEYQNRYVDSLQTFSAQSIHDHTTNDGRQHFRIGSSDPGRQC